MGKQLSKQTKPKQVLELANEERDSSSDEWTYGSESDYGTDESVDENDVGQPKQGYHEFTLTRGFTYKGMMKDDCYHG